MHLKWIFVALTFTMIFALTGCTAPIAELAGEVASASVNAVADAEGEPQAETKPALNLPSQGLAPELANEVWINSEPLRLADLRGSVVIVEFWTYG